MLYINNFILRVPYCIFCWSHCYANSLYQLTLSSLSFQISIAEVPIVQSFYHIAGALIVVHHSTTNVTYNFSTYKLPHPHSLKVTLDPTTHIQNVYLHVSDRDNNHLEVNV